MSALPRPSTAGNRPAYMNKLFSENPLPPIPSTPHIRSPNNSISSGSMSTSESRSVHQAFPSSCLGLEQDTHDDKMSIRSFRSHLSSRFSIRSVLKRRTYPRDVQETADTNPVKTIPPYDLVATRRPSLPKLQTAFSSSSRKRRHQHTPSKPLPPVPSATPEELECQPCYYFAARNCNGYVMGGSHGDACENCAQAGFFGAI